MFVLVKSCQIVRFPGSNIQGYLLVSLLKEIFASLGRGFDSDAIPAIDNERLSVRFHKGMFSADIQKVTIFNIIEVFELVLGQIPSIIIVDEDLSGVDSHHDEKQSHQLLSHPYSNLV